MDRKLTYSEEERQSLEREYGAIFSTADSFSKEVARQIERVLEHEGVALGFPIQHRVKSWVSLCDKLERVDFHASTIMDFQDLVGLRLILLFKRDVDRACEALGQNFSVLRRYDTRERLKTDQFGYSSVHFVVELKKDWLSLPTLANMAGLKAEIQVRTLPQHTWAEASHNLQYKSIESMPVSVNRAINRVSALLEMVDLEFERVLVERDSYRNDVDVSGTDDLLNVDLIEKTLDALLPAANKGDEGFAELLDDLTNFGIQKQQELRDLVMRHLPAILEEERAVVSSIMNHARINRTPLNGRYARGVFLTHVGLVRVALRQEFPGFNEYLNKRRQERELPNQIP
jgi:putative GTP pyrophosphokinase